MLAFLCVLLTTAVNDCAVARSAYVTTVYNGAATVSAGAKDGVAKGSTLAVRRAGKQIGSLKVTSVEERSSTGTWSAADTVLRVGDSVQLPEALATTSGGVPPSAAAPAASTKVVYTGRKRALQAYVAGVETDGIRLAAGATDGVSLGDALSILRGDEIINRATVTTLEADACLAKLADPNTPVRVGDAVRGETEEVRLVPPRAARPQVLRTTHEEPPPLKPPKRPKTYSVPRNHQSYDLLGALATRGLIKKYPARVFFDDRVFRHRPDDDLVLTRRQIAELVKEALANAGTSGGLDRGVALALKRLVGWYSEELTRLSVNVEHALAELDLAVAVRMPWGVTGFARVRRTSQNVGLIGEPQIGDSAALDLHGSLWADLAGKFRFFGSLESAYDRDGLHAHLNRAVLSADWDWLSLELGKDRFWYGPGHYGGLLLSDYARPYEYVRTTMRAGDLTYEGFLTAGLRRPGGVALVGHKVEVAYSPTVRFGVAETLLSSGGRLPLDYAAAALAPILPFRVVDDLNGGDDDNALASMYVEASVAKGFQTYFEFLIDDFVMRADETSRNRTGFLFGGNWHDADEPDRLNFRLEYARLDPGVYGPTDPSENYFELGVPIGYPLSPAMAPGTEMEDYRMEFQYKPTQKLTLGFGYQWSNFGFEQAVHMKQTTMRLRAAYDFDRDYSAAVRYRRAVIQNVGFVKGARTTDNMAEAELFRSF